MGSSPILGTSQRRENGEALIESASPYFILCPRNTRLSVERGASNIAKADNGHIVDLGSQYEMARLNTHTSEGLNRRLNYRFADGLGTKTDQAQEALQLQLTIFGGCGDLP